MPTVYTSSRSNSQILQELLQVFSTGRGTAREQWSMQAEMLVEPVGWDALWKLSKEFCKKFDVRFPCIAYVTITTVDFDNLSACVDVLSVQHESVTLPERVIDVPLIELWPTTEQREQFVNAATTAEFIELLRFYYTEIWMPWDDQDDKVLLSTTVEERFQLWLDMHNGTIPSCVARSIVLLRNSAINAHQRLQVLDSSLLDEDGEMCNDDDSLLPPNYISHCAELNAKLDGLMAKWTLYENPLIRKQYLAKVQNKWTKEKNKRHVIALWQGGSPLEFEEMFKFIRPRVSNEHSLAVMVSAEEALSLEPEELVICSKQYEMPEMPLMEISICSFNGASLTAPDMRSCLLMLSGACRLQHLSLQCARVNTAIVMRSGSLHVQNCSFLDDSESSQSDFAQGIVAQAGAKIVLENCTFDNFYSGIVVHKGAEIDASTGEEETNASVLRRSVQLARCLRSLSLEPGDVLALSGKSHLDLQIPYVTAMMNGLPIFGIDPTYKIDEVKSMFKVTEPKIAFCEPECYDDYVQASRALGLQVKVFTFGDGDHSMRKLLETYNDDTPVEEFQVVTLDPEKYVWLVSSGGTTGVLKVAAVSHKSLIHQLGAMLYGMFGNVNRDKLPHLPALHLSSIQWVSGMFNMACMPLLHQTRIQTSSPATSEHIVDMINKYKPISAMFSPSLATSILKSDKAVDMTCFRSIALTGGKVYEDILLGMKERAINAVIIEAYGQTESLGPVLAPNPRGPLGNCGRPVPTTQVKLMDPETGTEITEPNVTGELWTKGPSFTCYYNNPEETAQAFSPDGWFKTGDLLYRDPDNNYYFVERLKMLIKYRNYHIIPPELETVIRTHEGVADVSVTSIPHKEDGEHAVACVVKRSGATVTAQEIKDLVAGKLSDSKKLRGGVVFLDQIPTTPTGKVARARLRQVVGNMHRE